MPPSRPLFGAHLSPLPPLALVTATTAAGQGRWDTDQMRHIDAESLRDRLQREDPDYRYLVREQPEDGWEVVRIGLAQRPSQHLTAERGEPADLPEDPRPSLIRQIPPYGPPGLG